MTQAIKLETVSLLRQPPKWRPSPLHRAAKIRSYFRLLKEHGLPSERLVAGTGLPVDVDADPDRMIRVDQYYRVVDNLLVALPEVGLGTKAGAVFDFANMGILGYAMKSARTLEDVGALWGRYCDSLYGAPLRFHLRDEHRGWSLRIDCNAPPHPYAAVFC